MKDFQFNPTINCWHDGIEYYYQIDFQESATNDIGEPLEPIEGKATSPTQLAAAIANQIRLALRQTITNQHS